MADGRCDVCPQPPGRSAGVLGFTAHHVSAANVPLEWVRQRLDPDDLSAPLGVRFLAALSERIEREPGALDVVLVAANDTAAAADLVPVADVDHPRVHRAHRYRTDVAAYRSTAGWWSSDAGFAGRWEVAIEVDQAVRGRGLGRRLAMAARSLVPSGEPVWAQVSPGEGCLAPSVHGRRLCPCRLGGALR